MSALTLQVPEEIVAKLAKTPQEAIIRIQSELAVSLYSQGVISHAEACLLTGQSRSEFEQVLAQRDALRPYTPEMLREELPDANGHS
jgi:predicted HTH domain antitoxin